MTPFAAIAARIEAFRQGSARAWVRGGEKHCHRVAICGGKTQIAFPELAAELVRLKVDVIVTGGPTTTRAAKEATVYDSHCHGV